MAGLSTDDRSIIEKKFHALEGPVTVLLHKPEGKEELFDDFMAALEEICAMSDLLSLKDMVEMETNEEIIHDVDMFPALVLLDKDGIDHGIRFYGVPTNRTFSVFIETIVLFSNGKIEIEEEDQEKIKALGENRLQILCTPSVPDLEKYLTMTFGLSYLNEKIECAVIDLIQFPDMAEKYRVLDMPKTISNDDLRYTGVYDLSETLEILSKRIGDAEG